MQILQRDDMLLSAESAWSNSSLCPNQLGWKQTYARVDWAEATITPISCRRDRNRSAKRLLVILFSTFSTVEIVSKPSFPFVTLSRMKWHRTSICFEALWWTGLFANATAPWLSLKTTGAEFGWTCQNVKANRLRHSASFVALDATTYSTSVVEVAMHSWSFDIHDIAPCLNQKKYPDVDFWLFRQPTKSESI